MRVLLGPEDPPQGRMEEDGMIRRDQPLQIQDMMDNVNLGDNDHRNDGRMDRDGGNPKPEDNANPRACASLKQRKVTGK